MTANQILDKINQRAQNLDLLNNISRKCFTWKVS